MTIYAVYDQMAELLATLDPAKVLAMRASNDMQARFDELVQKSADNQLSKAEKDELDRYIVLERLMRLAKIRVRPSGIVSRADMSRTRYAI